MGQIEQNYMCQVGWLVGWFSYVSTLLVSFNAESIFSKIQFNILYSFCLQKVRYQNSSISNNLVYHK